MASDQSGIDESVFVETDEKLRGKHLANFAFEECQSAVW